MRSASPLSRAGSDAAKNIAAQQGDVAYGTAEQRAVQPFADDALSAASSSFFLEQSEKRAFLRRLATAPVLLGLVLWLALQ